MFFNYLHATLLTLVASIVSVSATPSLLVKVTGEPSVDGVDKLVMTTTIINTGDEILTLLNHPESPLNKLPANTFTITNVHGDNPTFTGINAKYVPDVAIAAGNDAVTILSPGQFIEVEHNLAEAYTFNKEGEYNIIANNHFYLVNANKEAVSIYATTEAHTTNLTGKLTVRRSTEIKRANYKGCSLERRRVLDRVTSEAQILVADALSYLVLHPYSTPRFDTWFGTYTTSHHTNVTDHFKAISNNKFCSYTFDCESIECGKGMWAYVYRNIFGRIHLCDPFWKAPNTGTHSKSGTLVHESSHFTANGGTRDYTYGKEKSTKLAIDDPAEAIMNADSYEYFAENSPVLP